MNHWRFHILIHLPTWQIQCLIIYRHELRIELLHGYMMWSSNLRPLLNPMTMDGILHRWSVGGINCLSISFMYRYLSTQLIIDFFWLFFNFFIFIDLHGYDLISKMSGSYLIYSIFLAS